MICPKCGQRMDSITCKACKLDVSSERITYIGSEARFQLKVVECAVVEKKQSEVEKTTKEDLNSSNETIPKGSAVTKTDSKQGRIEGKKNIWGLSPVDTEIFFIIYGILLVIAAWPFIVYFILPRMINTETTPALCLLIVDFLGIFSFVNIPNNASKEEIGETVLFCLKMAVLVVIAVVLIVIGVITGNNIYKILLGIYTESILPALNAFMYIYDSGVRKFSVIILLEIPFLVGCAYFVGLYLSNA